MDVHKETTVISLAHAGRNGKVERYGTLSSSLHSIRKFLEPSSRAKGRSVPETAPSIEEAVSWIARLGGYLGRKSDGPPGMVAIWRGWKRLADLSEGWCLYSGYNTCG